MDLAKRNESHENTGKYYKLLGNHYHQSIDELKSDVTKFTEEIRNNKIELKGIKNLLRRRIRDRSDK